MESRSLSRSHRVNDNEDTNDEEDDSKYTYIKQKHGKYEEANSAERIGFPEGVIFPSKEDHDLTMEDTKNKQDDKKDKKKEEKVSIMGNQKSNEENKG